MALSQMRAKSAPKRSGKIQEIRIEPAENGVTSTIRRGPAPGQKNPMMDLDQPPERTLHTKVSHLVNHIKQHTAEFFPKAQQAAHEAAESPEKEAAEEAATPEAD